MSRKPVSTEQPELQMLMTTEQLAEYLQVPISTLYYWREKGTGPRAFHVGRCLRYRICDIESWLDEQAK